MKPCRHIYVVFDDQGDFRSAADLECDAEYDAEYLSSGISTVRRYRLEPVSTYVKKIAMRRTKQRTSRKRHV